ncbi:hypothetical protein KKI24_18615 [bacterium]|nr:hypothetical protein [bacterium]
MKKKSRLNRTPDWMDPANDRTTPYSEEELDLFVEGFINNMGSDWEDLVSKLGEEKARRIIKLGFRKQDENHLANIEADSTFIN